MGALKIAPTLSIVFTLFVLESTFMIHNANAVVENGTDFVEARKKFESPTQAVVAANATTPEVTGHIADIKNRLFGGNGITEAANTEDKANKSTKKKVTSEKIHRLLARFEDPNSPKSPAKPSDLAPVVSDAKSEKDEEVAEAKVCDNVEPNNPEFGDKKDYAIYCKKKVKGKLLPRNAVTLEYYKSLHDHRFGLEYYKKFGTNIEHHTLLFDGQRLEEKEIAHEFFRTLFVRMVLDKKYESEDDDTILAMKKAVLKYFIEQTLEQEKYKFGSRDRYEHQVNYVVVYKDFIVANDEEVYEMFGFKKREDGHMVFHLENKSSQQY